MDQPKLDIAMLIYPGMTLLDMIGPQTALAMHANICLVWKNMGPVLTDTGVTILPTATFANCPTQLDVLFVPGGMGAFDVMMDPEVQAFLRSRGETARYVTSVCTGSIILSAAGLMKGYKAATHWATRAILAELGTDVSSDRVVVDRNRITGGGVTAGIDFGLSLLAELRGEAAARTAQLMMEYDPAPPFDSGSPKSAGPEIVAMVKSFTQPHDDYGLENARRLNRGALVAA